MFLNLLLAFAGNFPYRYHLRHRGLHRRARRPSRHSFGDSDALTARRAPATALFGFACHPIQQLRNGKHNVHGIAGLVGVNIAAAVAAIVRVIILNHTKGADTPLGIRQEMSVNRSYYMC